MPTPGSSLSSRARSGSPRPHAAWSSPALAAVVVFIVTFTIYLPTLRNAFVNWDDDGYITENERARHLSLENALWAFTTGHKANWHPVTWLSHMLDGSLWGLDPRGHHLSSMLLHAANAALLLLVLHRLTGELVPSLLVSAVLGLHPLNVESVAWVSERKNLVAMFFWLLVLLVYASYAAKPTLGRYLLMCFLFALGLMAKPILVTLPFVLLLLDYWPLRRLAARSVAEKIPLFALAVVSGVITLLVQARGKAVASTATLPLELRIENAAVSMVRYLVKAAWPENQSVFYPFPGTSGVPPVPRWLFVSVIVALAALTAAAWLFRRRAPQLVVGWLWYVITLLPVIGLVQVGSQAMADRYAYFPIVGLSIALAWSVPAIRRRPAAFWPSIVIAVALALLGSRTVARERVWRDSVSLWEQALEQYPRCQVALLNYGNALLAERRWNEAMVPLQALLERSPDWPQARVNLARAFVGVGEYASAIEQYRRELQVRPDNVEAERALAWVLDRQRATNGP